MFKEPLFLNVFCIIVSFHYTCVWFLVVHDDFVLYADGAVLFLVKITMLVSKLICRNTFARSDSSRVFEI